MTVATVPSTRRLAAIGGVSDKALRRWRSELGAPAKLDLDDGAQAEDVRSWAEWCRRMSGDASQPAGLRRVWRRTGMQLRAWCDAQGAEQPAKPIDETSKIGTQAAADGLRLPGEDPDDRLRLETTARHTSESLASGRVSEAAASDLIRMGHTPMQVADLAARCAKHRQECLREQERLRELLPAAEVEAALGQFAALAIEDLQHIWSGLLPAMQTLDDRQRRGMRQAFTKAVRSYRERVAQAMERVTQ